MDQIKLESLWQESRLLGAAENVIFPTIKLLQQQRMDMACSRFTAGSTEFIADIAYIQGLKDLESRLKRLQTEGNKANYELNKDQIK